MMPPIPPSVPTQTGKPQTLFRLLGANLNSTADQLFTVMLGLTSFNIEKIVATNASGPITVAVGGIYTAPAKAGTAIVGASQSWAALTSSTKVFSPALSLTGGDLMTGSTIYLSLTTPMGSAGTCDIYIQGVAW